MTTNWAVDEDFWQQSNIRSTIFEESDETFSGLKKSLQAVVPVSEAHDDDDKSVDDGFERLNWPNESSSLPASARYKSSSEPPRLVKNDASLAEVAKLEAEVSSLRKSKTEDRVRADGVVLKIILDQDHFLEGCRSFEKKKEILSKAISLHDGNAITKAIVHLAKTTKPQLFHQILMQQQVAADHYLNYLRISEKFSELADLQEMLGQSETAAMIKYEVVLKKQDPDSVVKHLDACLQSHFRNRYDIASESKILEEHLLLLQLQQIIQGADTKTSNADLQSYPPEKPLWRSSLVDTLHYCCLYHKGEKETTYSCPERFRKEFHLTTKQYSYVCVSALAERMIWTGIENEIFVKNILGKIKLKSEINMEKILEIMHKKKAPTEILAKFVEKIDDLETRLKMATTYKCHEIAIQTLVQRKNYHDLKAYASKLPADSKAKFFADDMLRRTDIKWKNNV